MTYTELLNDLIVRYPVLSDVKNEIAAAHLLLRACFAAGGKLLVAGNGGSAADAEHIVGELMKGFVKKRPLNEEMRQRLIDVDETRGRLLSDTLQGAMPAISLVGHAALSTAFANDRDPLATLAQQVWGYGREGDVLFCLSTSGNAENLLLAATAARARGMKVILLTGKDGGKLRAFADVAIRLPETVTYKVQELHLPVYHALCMMLESDFFEE